ncbi:hypothetical protein [Streptomyces sp. CA-132043]|uniref:hypothetical protein n=1 Tax=Streptomyces sp. CA-132043 TaxID=3240048 RepID=UPI003D8E67C8
MTRTKKALAAGALCAGILTGTAGQALAQTATPPERNNTVAPSERNNHGTIAPPDRNQTVTALPPQGRNTAVTAKEHSQPVVTGKSVHVMARIPWDKSGRDKVPKCARHGKLNTSGVTDHLKVINRCRSSVTYHVILDKHSDYWRKVPSGYYWTSSWKWPAKLHKIGT